jgi:hypothetical protein
MRDAHKHGCSAGFQGVCAKTRLCLRSCWGAHFGLVAVSLRVQRAAVVSIRIPSRAISQHPIQRDSFVTGLVWMLLYNLGLRSTFKPQRGKVCFIVKSGIGLGDLRLCLL